MGEAQACSFMGKHYREDDGGISDANGLPTKRSREEGSPAPAADAAEVFDKTADSVSSASEVGSSGVYSSRATSATFVQSSDAGEEEEEADDIDIQQLLLMHAKATSKTVRANQPNGNGSQSTIGVQLRECSKENPVTLALQRMNAELSKPVATSTALAVVNAADESADVLQHTVASKLPPPPPGETKKLRRLTYVDHTTVDYLPIHKDFYVVPPDVKDLTEEEMKELYRELDGARLRGSRIPRPMRSWHGTGLPDGVLDVLEKHSYKFPFAVQSLGAPVLMSGRDLLVTAKTGSGKTLAYVLPLIRHCLGQPRCGPNEGPIGLILVPTHELAAQVFQLLTEVCDAARLRCVASYGSTPLSDNIRHAKAGSDAMVCTPGRLLDLLTVNGGNVLSLQRTSFVVIDEADRLFDSGFMEHVEAFLKNIRPDRVVAMISATMPKELRKIVTQHMTDPIELTVGGKPTPASNVEQRFYFFDEEVYEVDDEKRKEEQRFVKLMQILGNEGGSGEHLILIFTQRREEVDELMASLSALGYRNRIATLYSGMDPIDREFALEHFSPGHQFILIATGVAERGLDIPYLELVINYTLPNHYEAYVHRIGRTGRAGRKGKAISFFTRGKDDDIAPDLVEGLERASQQVPEELYERAAKVRELRKDGLVKHNVSFYRGYLKAKAQRFTSRDQKEQIRAAARDAGLDGYLSLDSDNDSDAESGGSEPEIVAVPANRRGNQPESVPSTALSLHRAGSNRALTLATQQDDRVAKALAFAQKTTDAVSLEHGDDVRFQVEYLINDLPNVVRGKLQSAAFLRTVMSETETTIVRKGVYYDPRYKYSHKMKEGDRPLYLLIIGRTTEAVQEARRKFNDMKSEMLNRQAKKASATGVQL